MLSDLPRIGETVRDLIFTGRRDAFYVPVVLVHTNTSVIHPGTPVRFTDDSFDHVEACEREKSHAIADPYMSGFVSDSDTAFWVMLNPGLITDLTHSYQIRRIEFENDADHEDDACSGCNE